jgi:hypothetical protein
MMMRLCSVSTCYRPVATRHRFPNPGKYPERFSDWLKRINNTQLITLDSWKLESIQSPHCMRSALRESLFYCK